MRKLMRARWAVLAAVFVFIFVAADSCDEEDTGQEKESASGKSAYDKMVQKEPAHSMADSTTRKTINFWIDTWADPNALSYNYIGTIDPATGQYNASVYYVLRGLPVSYCTSLRPNYTMYDVDQDGLGPNTMVPAPASDGAWYSGGDCERYYGEDATTGAYVEYKVPMTAFIQTFSQPMVGEGFNNAVQVNGEKAKP